MKPPAYWIQRVTNGPRERRIVVSSAQPPRQRRLIWTGQRGPVNGRWLHPAFQNSLTCGPMAIGAWQRKAWHLKFTTTQKRRNLSCVTFAFNVNSLAAFFLFREALAILTGDLVG